MGSEDGAPDKDEKSINIEVPGDEKTRYVSVVMPFDQYSELNSLKDEYGLTWRGLLMHAYRQLSDPPSSPDSESETSQYAQLNHTRQRHGFTWKGMLLFASRDLKDDGN